MRDEHYLPAMEQVGMRDAQEARDGVQLRSAHWALHDHNATTALKRLDELPVGTARRTLALRLRLRAARMAGELAWRSRQRRASLAKHGPSRLPPRRAYCGAWRWN